MPSVWRSEHTGLADAGPSLEVLVAPPTPILRARIGEGKGSQMVSALGLIDTGAGCSCIDKGIARRLELEPRDELEVLTPAGVAVQYLYDVRLTLAEMGGLDLEVLGSDLERQAHHVLLGRDVLRHGTLIYSGRSNSFEFCV